MKDCARVVVAKMENLFWLKSTKVFTMSQRARYWFLRPASTISLVLILASVIPLAANLLSVSDASFQAEASM